MSTTTSALISSGDLPAIRAALMRSISSRGQARERFMRKCSGLKTSQNQEWAEVREAWRGYNDMGYF
ncbi:hypothetical protein [Falsiruegeria litorea]|uniref:hypothetical protein n=1 Tax=Falsiruegeria litorea TaxID=1280831 RepID=UPI001BFDC0B4|nr:hypothetical protein [Falsiruegeria litorea]MBT8167485.1 hypothetical protein [Falsiruegeria litorea]